MKTIKVKLADSIYDSFISFVKTLPEEKISIYEEIDDTHIDFMDEEEKDEILEILKDKDSVKMTKRKSVKL